jgi:hypothetical protein
MLQAFFSKKLAQMSYEDELPPGLDDDVPSIHNPLSLHPTPHLPMRMMPPHMPMPVGHLRPPPIHNQVPAAKAALPVPVRTIGSWTEYRSPQGETYYFNINSRLTQWHAPPEMMMLHPPPSSSAKAASNSAPNVRFQYFHFWGLIFV